MIGQIISNYKIIREIDNGGMGTVYLGEHITLDKKVAIKRMHPHLTKEENIRKRFLQEAETQSKLKHHGITNIVDYVDDENGLFIILEYLEGYPLNKYIFEEKGLIPEGEANALMTKILDAVGYAHKNNIIHRDLKPSNIFVLPNKDIKILDFGIAKIIGNDNNLTQTGTKLGSPLYMSPEQVLGKDIDHRSDIYSLGVLYYEMLTGNPVYNQQTTTQYQIYDRIVKEPLPRVKERYAHTSDLAQEIIDKATNKDTNQRFTSCNDFIKALNHGKVYEKVVEKSQKKEKTKGILFGIIALIGLIAGAYYFTQETNIVQIEERNKTLVNDITDEKTREKQAEMRRKEKIEADAHARKERESALVETNESYLLKDRTNLRSSPMIGNNIVLSGAELVSDYNKTGKNYVKLKDIRVTSYKRQKKQSEVEKGCDSNPEFNYWHNVELVKEGKRYTGWMWGGCLEKKR